MSKTYVIGDIHGCYDELIELVNQIGITDDDLIISLGDIVDRGNKSLEVYDYFKNRKHSVVLMGNHERKHLNGVLSYSQDIVNVQFGDRYEEFLEWLDTLPYYYETAEAIIVHAFYEHDKLLKEQKEEVLAGTTSGSRYLDDKYKEGKNWVAYYSGSKPIIYGHHVVGYIPKVENNTYGIDTGACHKGKLTALELPSFKIHQVDVIKDHWKEEQSVWQIPVLQAKDWENMAISQVYKQIEKLEYKEEQEVKDFLKELKEWINEIEDLRPQILTKINELTNELSIKFVDDFNKEVAKLNYRTFVFKTRANNLVLDDLKKVLNSPQKLIDLAKELSIGDLPVRKVS